MPDRTGRRTDHPLVPGHPDRQRQARSPDQMLGDCDEGRSMTHPDPVPTATPYRQWIAAWPGMAALGVANGLSRGLYARSLGEARAHQVSTATLIAALVPYAHAVDRRWPVPTARAAAGVGATWVVLTVAFEFGFGHFVAKQSWDTLRADYDLRRGRLWPLVLVATAAAPAAARTLRLRRTTAPD